MKIPYIRGRVATQAHVGVPEGTCEEEYARNGFSGRYAHLYRTESPTGWTQIDGELRPRAYDPAHQWVPGSTRPGDWLGSRRAYLENEDVRLHLASIDEPMPYFFRNADADELLFIHEGTGRIETDFGPLDFEPGDYLIIPRGTVYRLAPLKCRARMLVIESFSEIRFPEKGMLGEHALFDPAVIRVPSPEPSQARPSVTGEYELRIQRLGQISSVFYPFNPLNTVGWKGTLSVMQLNVRDIRPVSCDRYHLPPSAHTTFLGQNWVVCSFLPRPLENGDPTAMKVPFIHSNIDFDEVLFYHSGQFFSREGIGQGMITFHPQGIHHGPQPGAEKRTGGVQRTEEVAVMLDTRRPLRPTAWAAESELKDYWLSWQPKDKTSKERKN
jgi:homogentisate 1,2-dioxygenase